MQHWKSYKYLIAAMALSTQAASASELQPNVVVMVSPLTSYVGAIMKNVATPQSLLNDYQDPHDFVMAPSQAQMLDKADILIVPDLGMNPTFAGLAARNKKMKIIELSHLQGAAPLPYPAENPWLAKALKAAKEAADKAANEMAGASTEYKKLEPFDKPEEAPQPAGKPDDIDPHFWLDPERLAAMAPSLAFELSSLYPTHQKSFEANAKIISQHLREEVIPGLNGMLAIPRTRLARNNEQNLPYISYHPGYQYLLGRLGLPYTGVITTRPDEYIGGKSLELMLNTAKTTRIRCIMAESSTPTVERVARASGAQIVMLAVEQPVPLNETPPLTWLRSDYDRLLYKATKSFGDCL
jgi:zinc transport system substrate-binding protein